MCGARRGTISQREKVTGRAFDRQIGSTKRGIAMQTSGSGSDSPSAAIFATLPVTASGHPGNLGLDLDVQLMSGNCKDPTPPSALGPPSGEFSGPTAPANLGYPTLPLKSGFFTDDDPICGRRRSAKPQVLNGLPTGDPQDKAMTPAGKARNGCYGALH